MSDGDRVRALCLCGHPYDAHGYGGHEYPMPKGANLQCFAQCGCRIFVVWDQESLRDKFAGQALIGYLAQEGAKNPGQPGAILGWEHVAEAVYRGADAMLAERAKGAPKNG